MKKLLFLSIFISLASCKNDDDFHKSPPAIIGEWNMISFTYPNDEPTNITKGDIVWIIGTSNITMINESPYSFASPRGTYPYAWVNNYEDIKIELKNETVYVKVTTNTTSLHLTQTSEPGQPEVNEPVVIKFEK